jgi:hypothetical protein
MTPPFPLPVHSTSPLRFCTMSPGAIPVKLQGVPFLVGVGLLHTNVRVENPSRKYRLPLHVALQGDHSVHPRPPFTSTAQGCVLHSTVSVWRARLHAAPSGAVGGTQPRVRVLFPVPHENLPKARGSQEGNQSPLGKPKTKEI